MSPDTEAFRKYEVFHRSMGFEKHRGSETVRHKVLAKVKERNTKNSNI